MNRIDHTTDRTRKPTIHQLLVLGVAAILLGSTSGILFLSNTSWAAIPTTEDCTDNAVMVCGCQNGTDCAEKLHESATTGMKAAYAHFGLSPGDYDRFATEGVEGMAHPDGTVTRSDSGDAVMTNASSIGRMDFGYGDYYPIDGHDFYLSHHEHTGILQDQSLPVIILMNSYGEAEFAMIKACGNPIKGDVVEKEPPQKAPPQEEKPREVKVGELPAAGASSILGIFVSATGAGVAAHRLLTRKCK